MKIYCFTWKLKILGLSYSTLNKSKSKPYTIKHFSQKFVVHKLYIMWYVISKAIQNDLYKMFILYNYYYCRLFVASKGHHYYELRNGKDKRQSRRFFSYTWHIVCSILAVLERFVLPLDWDSSHEVLQKNISFLTTSPLQKILSLTLYNVNRKILKEILEILL